MKNPFRRKPKLRPYQQEMIDNLHKQISGRSLRSNQKTLIIDKATTCGPYERQKHFYSQCLGIPWTAINLNFETLTEYNGVSTEA